MSISKTDFCFAVTRKSLFTKACAEDHRIRYTKTSPLTGQSPDAECFVVCRSIYLLNILASINKICLQYNTVWIKKQGLSAYLQG